MKRITKEVRKGDYTDTIQQIECAFDVMTTVYYARTLDFSTTKVNDTVPLTMVLDGKKYETYVRYTGKGVEKSRDGILYKVFIRPMLIEGTISQAEDMEVSVTDDKNRIPLFVEANILVGSIKVYLERMTGFKYPLDSKIE